MLTRLQRKRKEEEEKGSGTGKGKAPLASSSPAQDDQKKRVLPPRKMRGLMRANTYYEYEGHPETRESVDNPFNSTLMGRIIELFFKKDNAWREAKVVEFHAFDGLHLVQFTDNNEKAFFNLSKKSYRFPQGSAEPSTKKAKKAGKAAPPTKSKKTKTKKASAPTTPVADDDDDDDEDEDGIPVPSTAAAPTPAPKKKAGLVRSISAASSVLKEPIIHPLSGLGGGLARVVKSGAGWLEAQLAFLDLAKNSDKFYHLQVVQSTKTGEDDVYWCIQHWGRTGTNGQFKTTQGTKDEAFAVFTAKFKEKSGLDYEDRDASPVSGKYRVKRVKYAAADDKEKKVMWQYYVDDYVDGKATGWYNYTESAANTVEGVYSEWQSNSYLCVRCVQSGYFQYLVDFNTMTQKNLRTQKCRKIRRTPM